MAKEPKTAEEKATLDEACPPGFRISVHAFVTNDAGVGSQVNISGRLLPESLTPEFFKGFGEKAIEAIEAATDKSGFRLMTDNEVEEYRADDSEPDFQQTVTRADLDRDDE